MAEAVRGRIIVGGRPRRRRGLAPFTPDDPRVYRATPFFAAALRRSALQAAGLIAAGAVAAVVLGVSLRPLAAGLAGAAAVAVVLAKLRAHRAARIVRYETMPADAELAPPTVPAHSALLAPVAGDGAAAAAILAGATHPHSPARVAALVMWAPGLGAAVVLAMLAYTVVSCVVWERRRGLGLFLPCGASRRDPDHPVIYTRPA